MRRFALLIAIVSGIAAAPAGADGPVPAPIKLPDDATIAGVPVGGLYRAATHAELERQLGARYERAVHVRIKGRHRALPTRRLGQTIRYGQMLDAAFERARRGKPVDVTLIRTIGPHRLTARILQLARPWFRPARNAHVTHFGIRHIARRRARWGRTLDQRRLRRALVRELWRPTRGRIVRGHLLRLRPAVTGRILRRRYGTYISVDRGTRLARLFKHLRHVRTYRVAVGAAGYDTPAGLHHVLSKEINPTWHVPSRPWAGSLAGLTIPPGDPRNPLKARFIAIGGGVGFHGTADLASIGQAASHGCIRMRIPDVISLYNRTPVGTPVLIR
jgi:hypothetical protein